MRADPIDRSQTVGAVKAEVFVGPALCKGKQCWRWDVTFLAIANVDRGRPELVGIDGRRHLGGECGYARTKAGAWRALRRAIESHPWVIV